MGRLPWRELGSKTRDQQVSCGGESERREGGREQGRQDLGEG